MVHFVGAGPGAPDLITQRGAALLQGADCIIYAGSLVNPALLGLAKPGCAIYNSAEMTLEQVLDTMRRMEAADFALTLIPGKTAPEALHLVPRIGVLGVGCKRGTTADQLEAAFAAFCAAHGLAPAGIRGAASIDLKQDEPGLAAFCAAHGWPITFYTARQLQAVEGHFTPSAFVRSVTGVDNVCERAAVCAADGPLQVPKQAGGGVTLALAAKPFAPDWSWKDAEP